MANEISGTVEERPSFPVEQLAIALNEAARLDPAAVGDLIQQRVPCNSDMCAHPGVPVSPEGEIGLMGLLNGALAKMGCMHRLAVEIGARGKLIEFWAILPECTDSRTAHAMSHPRRAPLSAAEAKHVAAWECGELAIERPECEVCRTRFECSPVHHSRCPTCAPGHTTIAELLSDSGYWPGHEFVWSVGRGPCGRWVTIETMWQPIRRIYDTVRELLPEADAEAYFADNLRAEMLRLRAIANEVAEPVRQRVEREQQRANRLAGKCITLRRLLNAKRAQCDELRDENDRLMAAVSLDRLSDVMGVDRAQPPANTGSGRTRPAG